MGSGRDTGLCLEASLSPQCDFPRAVPWTGVLPLVGAAAPQQEAATHHRESDSGATGLTVVQGMVTAPPDAQW